MRELHECIIARLRARKADPSVSSYAETVVWDLYSGGAPAETWRTFVEPRMIHATRDQGKGVNLRKSLSSNHEGVGGNGLLGSEWRMHDRLYRSMKMQFDSPFSWEDNGISMEIPDAGMNLHEEFRDLTSRVYRHVQAFVEAHKFDAPKSHDEVVEGALNAEAVNDALWLYRRQSAIYAHRRCVDPTPDLRSHQKLSADQAGLDDREVISKALRVLEW